MTAGEVGPGGGPKGQSLDKMGFLGVSLAVGHRKLLAYLQLHPRNESQLTLMPGICFEQIPFLLCESHVHIR